MKLPAIPAVGTLMHAMAAAKARIVARPVLSLAGAGFLAATATVVAGGQVGTVRTVIPLSSWLGLLSRGTQRPDVIAAVVMLIGVAALVVLWLVAIRFQHLGLTNERTVWAMCTAWTAPFIIGPPLLSNDVFTYAAQGLMLRSGVDPYQHGPAALGAVRAVAAVDPSWRSVPSPYGPLATTIQHLAIAISGGSPIGAVIVFRALGVVCLVAIGLLAAELAGPRRAQALTLTVLNPLVLLQVVSSAHLDGVMCALLLGAVVAGAQRAWVPAIVLAAAAGSVKAPAYFAVVAIIVVHHGARRRVAWRSLARDVAIGGLAIVGFSLVVQDGWGWIRGLNAPALGHTSLAPATLISDLFKPIVRSASYDDLAAGGRITALVAAACISLYLLATSDARSLERTIGYGMLAVGMLSPVVYPWYLLGGVVCLAPTARQAGRDWLVLVSGIGCLLSPPGFSSAVGTSIALGASAIAVAIVAPRELGRRRIRVASAAVGALTAPLPASALRRIDVAADTPIPAVGALE